MASRGSDIEKDLVEALEGMGAELAHAIAVSSISTSTTTSTTSSSSSETISMHTQPTSAPAAQGKTNLFFKFGQAVADVAVALVCCACNKGQQNISAQVESPVEPTQVQAAPKPK